MKRPAIFLDKDGTLIEDVPYNVDPQYIRLMPGAANALAVLHAAGYCLLVVSNQSGVARGYFQEGALARVEARLKELLAAARVPLAGFYYCPHHPEGTVTDYAITCACRKPQPGMILQAAHDHNIDLENSWLIGDILNDVEAGRRAGCRTILLDNGNETVWDLSPSRWPHYMVTHFSQVPPIILMAGPVTSTDIRPQTSLSPGESFQDIKKSGRLGPG